MKLSVSEGSIVILASTGPRVSTIQLKFCWLVKLDITYRDSLYLLPGSQI